jgi:hypothetical protein
VHHLPDIAAPAEEAPMSPNMVGAIIGFVVGFLGYVSIRMVANRVESQGVGEDPKRAANLLRMVAIFDFLFFIALGYSVGPMIVGNSG